MIRINDALASLCPGAEWAVQDDCYEGIVWHSPSIQKPTKAQVEAEVARLKVLYVNLEYQRQRQSAYPSIQDQLDTLYHSGLEAWKSQIKSIKDKYPKPSVQAKSGGKD